MTHEAATTNLVINEDWSTMSASEQKEYFAENGFLVLRGVIGPGDLDDILRDIQRSGLKGLTEKIWTARSLAPMIENRRLVPVLKNILGEDVRFFKGAYVETPPVNVTGPNTRPKVFHVDYGVGEESEDFRNSCASWINVGHYLTTMTPELAPFWVVPGTNRRCGIIPGSFMEHLADQAKMVLAKAGDAILIHCMTVHAGGLNLSEETRHAVFLSYRAGWARPVGRVPEWPREFVTQGPPERQGLLGGLNRGSALDRGSLGQRGKVLSRLNHIGKVLWRRLRG